MQHADVGALCLVRDTSHGDGKVPALVLQLARLAAGRAGCLHGRLPLQWRPFWRRDAQHVFHRRLRVGPVLLLPRCRCKRLPHASTAMPRLHESLQQITAYSFNALSFANAHKLSNRLVHTARLCTSVLATQRYGGLRTQHGL